MVIQLILVHLEKFSFSRRIDPINLNVDSDSEENGETPLQRLVRLHASPSNYNDRFFFPRKLFEDFH